MIPQRVVIAISVRFTGANCGIISVYEQLGIFRLELFTHPSQKRLETTSGTVYNNLCDERLPSARALAARAFCYSAISADQRSSSSAEIPLDVRKARKNSLLA